jgi:hypothetical protein
MSRRRRSLTDYQAHYDHILFAFGESNDLEEQQVPFPTWKEASAFRRDLYRYFNVLRDANDARNTPDPDLTRRLTDQANNLYITIEPTTKPHDPSAPGTVIIRRRLDLTEFLTNAFKDLKRDRSLFEPLPLKLKNDKPS